MAPFAADEFWDDLLAFVEQRRVIPVVGPELLRIRDQGRTVPLYRALADRLLARYAVVPPPGERYGLYEAVAAIAASGRRVRDLYRPVHDALLQLVHEHPEALTPLRQLAAIRHFDLFVSTTPDDLLVRALNEVRFQGNQGTLELEYAPKLPTNRRRDLTAPVSEEQPAVFYLFGKADVSPYFAIHEEDALEFPYTLQAGNGPERTFAEIRSRDLLFVGCALPDWLSRFFLRLANTDRLSSDQRTKREFLVGEETSQDRDFVMFLERFSRDSRFYQTDAATFVSDLHDRWSARNPYASRPKSERPSLAEGTVFISYSHDDIDAARQLYAEVQRMSGDVAWFDKDDLTPGDEWEPRIRSALQKCSIFLPLISARTEGRTEGYFRMEWSEAAERSKRIEGRRFIFPVVVDSNFNNDPGIYARVPERFRAFQYGHAPEGRMSEELHDALQKELRRLRGSGA